MTNRALIATGTIGSAFAAVCCATPILAIALGTLGLGAWLGKADYVLIPVLIASLGLIVLGLWRQRAAAQACCGSASPNRIHERE
jgi:mercuric ion transport protein